MPNIPSTVDLAGFSSWFENKQYVLQDKIEDALTDPIYSLFGEDVIPSKALTIDVTGRDGTRTGRTKAPGGKVAKQAPVEEDQMSRKYITFEDNMSIEWEALQHDLYQFADEQPEELVDNVFRGVSRLMHAQLFNSSTATTTTHPGTGGAYAIDLPDDQALFSTAHSGPNYSSKSNYLNSDLPLSTPNLSTAVQYGITNFVRSGGERQSFRPNCIIVPDNWLMVEAALQCSGSELVRETGNNSINVYSGGTMDVIVLKYAPEDPAAGHTITTTGQYNYIVANKEEMKKALRYKLLARPSVLTKFMDPENGDSTITVLARAAVYAKRWQFGVRVNATTAPTHPGA